MPHQPFQLKIRDRKEVLFEGEVKRVSSVNEKGKFDILPMHSNFISLIKEKVTVVPTNGQKKEFSISSAILRNKNSITEILIGFSTIPTTSEAKKLRKLIPSRL